MPITFIIPDVGAEPREAQMQKATLLKAGLAALKVRLFTDAIGAVSNSTTLAELDAAQAAFSGYTADGNTIAAFGDPFIDPEGAGALLVAPTTQFNFLDPDPDPAVTETIAGFYCVDSTGALRGAVRFDEPILMSDNTDSIPVVVAFRVE